MGHVGEHSVSCIGMNLLWHQPSLFWEAVIVQLCTTVLRKPFNLLPHMQNINKVKPIYIKLKQMLDKSILKTERISSSKLSLHPVCDTQRNLFILGRITTWNYVKAATSACDAPTSQNKIHPHLERMRTPCVELLRGEHSFTALARSLWIHQRADGTTDKGSVSTYIKSYILAAINPSWWHMAQAVIN